jgi:hypothetical protein
MTVTKTGDKFNVTIIDLEKEISKTQKSIKKLRNEYSEMLLNFGKATESFFDKFELTAETKKELVQDPEKFKVLQKFLNQEEYLFDSIELKEAYLKSLKMHIKFDIDYVNNCNCSEDEIEQLLKIFYRKFTSWVPSSLKDLYKDDIIFNIERLNFTLLIDYDFEKETDSSSDTENYLYYIAIFENKKDGKTLTLNVTLPNQTTKELYQPE